MNSTLYTGQTELAIAPVTYSTDSTANAGDIISLKGYKGVKVFVAFGNLTAGSSSIGILKGVSVSSASTTHTFSANAYKKVGLASNQWSAATVSSNAIAVANASDDNTIFVVDVQAEDLIDDDSGTLYDCLKVVVTNTGLSGGVCAWYELYNAANACIPTSLVAATVN